MNSFSPRAGIRGFDTRRFATRDGRGLAPTGFSPRAGIRGFDTRSAAPSTSAALQPHPVSVPERGFVALIRLSTAGRRSAPQCGSKVSVPERGFVALIRLRHAAVSLATLPNVSVPERGFVALILVKITRSACTSGQTPSFSPRAGIRGFDTRSRSCCYVTRMASMNSFSPRAGIRGFDTRTFATRDLQRTPAEQVSVPERGFVALIHRCGLVRHRQRRLGPGFSPRAGIRGFDTDSDGG